MINIPLHTLWGRNAGCFGQYIFFLKLLVHGTDLLSEKLCQFFFNYLPASLPHNSVEGSCEILNQQQSIAKIQTGLQ